MRAVDSSYILDSYALFAHFEDEAGGEKVGDMLKAAREGNKTLFISDKFRRDIL
jgi:hypothetical protein